MDRGRLGPGPSGPRSTGLWTTSTCCPRRQRAAPSRPCSAELATIVVAVARDQAHRRRARRAGAEGSRGRGRPSARRCRASAENQAGRGSSWRGSRSASVARAARRTCHAAAAISRQRLRRVERVQPEAAGGAGDRLVRATPSAAASSLQLPGGVASTAARSRGRAQSSSASSERSPPLTSAVWLTYRTLTAGASRRAAPSASLPPARRSAARRSLGPRRAPLPPPSRRGQLGVDAAVRSPPAPRATWSVGSTSSPVSPSTTASSAPPTLPARTGLP